MNNDFFILTVKIQYQLFKIYLNISFYCLNKQITHIIKVEAFINIFKYFNVLLLIIALDVCWNIKILYLIPNHTRSPTPPFFNEINTLYPLNDLENRLPFKISISLRFGLVPRRVPIFIYIGALIDSFKLLNLLVTFCFSIS